MGDLRFDLNNVDSYELFANIEKTNFLECTRLRYSVPLNLRKTNRNPDYIVLIHPFKLTSAFLMPELKRNQKTAIFSFSP